MPTYCIHCNGPVDLAGDYVDIRGNALHNECREEWLAQCFAECREATAGLYAHFCERCDDRKECRGTAEKTSAGHAKTKEGGA